MRGSSLLDELTAPGDAVLTEIGFIVWGIDAALGVVYLAAYARTRRHERLTLGLAFDLYATVIAPAVLAAAFACFFLDLVT